MTTKQAIRSVLKDTNKFIVGDYNGQKWYCPDGSFATVDNIYAMYKPKKSQDIFAFKPDNKQPRMSGIFDQVAKGHYVPSTTLEVPETTYTELLNGVTTVRVNTDYLQLMQALYPTAKFYIDTAFSYSPVKVIVRDYTKEDLYKLVAMIMPLHK